MWLDLQESKDSKIMIITLTFPIANYQKKGRSSLQILFKLYVKCMHYPQNYLLINHQSIESISYIYPVHTVTCSSIYKNPVTLLVRVCLSPISFKKNITI